MGWKEKKKVSSIWKSMKTKHFLINVGTNILASFSCFPSQAEAWNAASDMPLQVRTLIWCQNVGLQVRERSAVYWSVHGVLIHTIFFPTLVSSCQNAISEIVERMENVQPEEQKTQKRIRGHDLWMQLIESLLRGKNLAWHYFKGNSNHKWAKVIKEWISAQRWRKRAFPQKPGRLSQDESLKFRGKSWCTRQCYTQQGHWHPGCEGPGKNLEDMGMQTQKRKAQSTIWLEGKINLF